MKKNDDLILSVDLGTSNIKGAVFDISGKEIAKNSIEYNLLIPRESIVENNVEDYWEKIKNLLVELSKKLGDRVKNVIAIVSSSQAETILPVDKNINPLRNAIVWIDTRSKEEALEIAENFNNVELYTRTGYPEVDPSWPATRVLWLKKNEPEIFLRTHKFMLLHDYILYKLSGQILGEVTTYNSSYYYDIRKFTYIEEMLEFIGITKEKLPEVVRSGRIIGKISNEISSITGLGRNTNVIVGAMDQICGAIGAGNVEKGIATETTGSAFAMIITTGIPIINNDYKLPCILHALPDTYGLMPYSSSGGMVLKWFKDNFCYKEIEKAKKLERNVFQIMDIEAKKIQPGSEGVIMLPFLTGAFFPEYNPKAKAAFFGIGINNGKAHFIRSIMESIAYMMRNDIEAVKSSGIGIDRIISMGGGASSDLWSQIKSDVCKVKVDIPLYTETALLGSAMIACVSMGFYKDLVEASKSIVKIKKTFTPEKLNEKIYDDGFRKYNGLYKSLKNFF